MRTRSISMGQQVDNASVLTAETGAEEGTATAAPRDVHPVPDYYTFLLYTNMLLCVPIAAGSLLVVFVVFRYHKMRSLTNYTIANLAVADFLTAALALPLYSVVHFTGLGLTQHKNFCLLSLVTVAWVVFMTVVSVNIIALERYLFILHPFYYNTIKSHRILKGLMVSSWVFGLFLCIIAPLSGWNRWRMNSVDCALQISLTKEYAILSTVIMCLLIVSVTYMYARILLVAIRHRTAIKRQVGQQSTQIKSNMGVTKMMLIILGLYYIFVTPYIFMTIVKVLYFKVQPEWLDILTKVLVTSTLINSLANPVVYGTQNQMFRTAFKRILCRAQCRRQDDQGESFHLTSRADMV